MKRKSTSKQSIPSAKKSKQEKCQLDDEIQQNRFQTSDSILSFKFNRGRLRFLNELQVVPEDKEGIVYWMSRDQRVQDNWAMLFSQKLALKNHWPLHVAFCIDNTGRPTLRHFKFMLDGLKEVATELSELNINFHLLMGAPAEELLTFVQNFNIGCIVCDFTPLKPHRKTVDEIKAKLPTSIPLIQIDAHNIVPVWCASEKQEYAAQPFRIKVTEKLKEFLTDFPPLIEHPFDAKKSASEIDWEAVFNSMEVDTTVKEVDWVKSGSRSAIKTLEIFIQQRLKIYHKRNDPNVDCLSNLSPFIHFGQISSQRAMLEVQKHLEAASEGVELFCEDLAVRRELSDNFCFYNENYNNFKGIQDWGQKSLNEHRKDKREHVYTRDELEEARTHDDVWNSAQLQMVKEGKMHRNMRMYWAKKILEWTAAPEDAVLHAMYLNDRYSLDGTDPNGYVGCLWSIGGLHDRPWPDRKIFGKVRFMNYDGCKRKFKIDEYIARYGGIVHSKGAKKK